MTAPRHLADWPVVMVDVECSLCPRFGRYRLARLAERYGASVPLDRLLELIAADCTLMRPGEKPRHYEARCGIRYVVPPAESLPADAPARAGAPKPASSEGVKGAKRKRLGPDGPPPTLGQIRRQGCIGISATCLSLWQGHICHHTVTLPLDGLAASEDMVFLALCRSLRLVCSRCGERRMHIVPLWPDVRQKRAASMDVDTGPVLAQAGGAAGRSGQGRGASPRRTGAGPDGGRLFGDTSLTSTVPVTGVAVSVRTSKA